MKRRFILYRRKLGGTFYVEDTETRKQESLGTKDRAEATSLLNARNESVRQPQLNLQIAKAYLAGTDSGVSTRTTWPTIRQNQGALRAHSYLKLFSTATYGQILYAHLKSRHQKSAASAAFSVLLEAAGRLPFEPHDIAAQLDARGRYDVRLDEEFPLSIKLFHYTSRRHTRGATWHERLELFLPLDGPARFRMGEQEVELQAGELLVVDNLKLHHVVDFPGFDTRVVVISFLPEFVYSLGSPSHDYAFLLPFYSKVERRPHVVRASDAAAPEVHGALARLLECYFGGAAKPFFQAGSKAFLLALLYHLAAHFRASEVLKWEFMRQHERSLRLKKLFDHINARAAEKLSVGAAARLVGMSAPQFMKTFKQVAGMTLVAYLNHVRLTNATRLLRETNRTIADIADAAGFSDQSYFDKRFKRAFGRTPKEFRAEASR